MEASSTTGMPDSSAPRVRSNSTPPSSEWRLGNRSYARRARITVIHRNLCRQKALLGRSLARTVIVNGQVARPRAAGTEAAIRPRPRRSKVAQRRLTTTTHMSVLRQDTTELAGQEHINAGDGGACVEGAGTPLRAVPSAGCPQRQERGGRRRGPGAGRVPVGGDDLLMAVA